MIVEANLSGTTFLVIGDYSPGRPGRYSGPPENCCEAEPAEYLINEVKIVGEDGQSVVVPDWLVDMVIDELETACLEQIEGQQA